MCAGLRHSFVNDFYRILGLFLYYKDWYVNSFITSKITCYCFSDWLLLLTCRTPVVFSGNYCLANNSKKFWHQLAPIRQPFRVFWTQKRKFSTRNNIATTYFCYQSLPADWLDNMARLLQFAYLELKKLKAEQ
ncbi:hypothetical protein CRE_31195 [Caenorhabditis remanei]|uniref:Uncharacterized protein n=1 Tax=Caenorhabditis remanei TaxID=31234 RepID=E3MLI6_CAERE|nr:hypothetical protein CRE_31195 [Caenorhabditis remanei]